MDTLVPTLYGEYGRYINQFRAFPYILDGAKLVERRLLYCLYQVARERFVKSAKVVGHCIAHYHPHGDESAYSSLVGMVQNGFARGQGNWGTNVGVAPNPPAAQRYTEVRASKELLTLAFDYIKYVPHDEVEMDEEPVFLPTKLPICLLPANTYCQGMGFGYRTLVPAYKKDDLIKRLRWLLDGKKGTEPLIVPLSDCKITGQEIELRQLLETGKSRLEFVGKFKTEGRNTVVIESIPPSRSFGSILKKFEKEISVDKSLGWKDDSTTSTKVRLTIVKPRMLKMTTLTKKLKSVLTGYLTFECHVCNTKGKVVLLSVDEMLLNIHSVYTKVVISVLNDQIDNAQKSIDELSLIGLIKPILSVELKTNPDDLDLVINNIATQLSRKAEIIKEIFDKYNLSRIFRIKTDTQELTQQQTGLKKDLSNIDDYVWNEKYLK